MDNISVRILKNLGYEVAEASKPLFQRLGPWGTMILTGGLAGGSFLMNSEGNDAYDKYTQTVDPQIMNSRYDDAKSYDTKRNILIGVSTCSAILTAYLFKTQTGKEWEIRKVENDNGKLHYIPWIARTPDGSFLLGINLQIVAEGIK